MDYKLTSDMKPASGYNVGGVSRIWLSDIEDFASYQFEENDSGCRRMVTSVSASSPFIELGIMAEANFTEDCVDNIFRQKLSAFIEPLSAEMSAKLLIATGNKYLVLFRSPQGKFFTFGSDGGASLSFTQQTGAGNESSGYAVTIVKNSIYPLFESLDICEPLIPYTYRPVFSANVFCRLRNGKRTGYKLANYAVKETRNGQALDVNGKLCSRSGRKQAIYLLERTSNPNSDKYEIEDEYSSDAKDIEGISIIARDIEQCAPYFADSITIPLRQLIFDDESNVTVMLTSLHQWQLTASSNIAACLPVQGKAGRTALVFSKTNSEGIANYRFKNQVTQQTVTLNIINKENVEWVLKNGEWNENGVWLLSGVWG
jgi:hypothetical protein